MHRLCNFGFIKYPYMTSVNCPPGMKESGGQCVACDVGTYQDMEGQVTCTECPQGQVTESTGSDSLALCVSEWTTSTSVGK